ncbi:MAG: hypothetical protein E7290_10290 [Lachnospiraceae bacterium]|nr:hypothetical protein [Lachnospiraceae bacterium]
MRRRLDNKGSALITVLIAVTFLSILVTTLLYVSVTNYETKQIDYQNKNSFYLCEAPLEEMKVLMVQEASESFEAAYREVMKYYATKNADVREDIYKAAFVNALKQQWLDKSGATDIEKMKGLMTSENQALVTDVGTWNYVVADGTATLGPIQVGISTDTGYTTMVSAYIYIEAPDLNLSRNSADSYAGTDIADEKIVIADYVVFKNWMKQ